MALANWALCTEAEARQELNLVSEATADQVALWGVIELATLTIEKQLAGRELRYRSAKTDIADVRPDAGVPDLIYTIDRPIFAITSVKESDSLATAWSAITALTLNTDYSVDYARGRIERLSSGMSRELLSSDSEYWGSGLSSYGSSRPTWKRYVQVAYSAGFRGIDGQPSAAEALPGIYTLICRELVALKWKEIKRGQQGVSAVTDETGNYQRFGAAKLTAAHVEMLRDEMRSDYTGNTTRAVNF